MSPFCRGLRRRAKAHAFRVLAALIAVLLPLQGISGAMAAIHAPAHYHVRGAVGTERPAHAQLHVPVGNEIPGSIPLVVSSGISAHYDNGWLASAQLKHFGKYPLIEDSSVESAGSTIVNLRVGREWNKVGLFLDVINLLDSDDHDIDYFYASRLQEEPESGIEDIHYHVFPSRSLRLSLRYTF